METLKVRDSKGKYQEAGRFNEIKEESGCFSELSKVFNLLQSSHRVRKEYGLGILSSAAPAVVHEQQHQASLRAC